MDRRPSLSYLPEQEGDEAEAAAAGLDEVALSSPRIVGQDWEQNGGSVIDLEAEKKRYLNQKQKRALSHKRIRDLDNSLDRDRSVSSSSSEAEAVGGGAGNDKNQLPSQAEKSPEIAEGNEGDAQGRVEASDPSDAASAATPPDQAAMKMNLDELGDEEEGRGKEGKEEWEKAADEPEAEPPSSSSSSSPTNEAAQPEQPVEGKPAAEEDQAGGGEKALGQGKGGGGLLSQLKNLMGSLSSKVRDGAVAAAGTNGGEGDDGDDNDEREDVWDELRVRTLRNTLVNKHMSHLDLNSKQVPPCAVLTSPRLLLLTRVVCRVCRVSCWISYDAMADRAGQRECGVLGGRVPGGRGGRGRGRPQPVLALGDPGRHPPPHAPGHSHVGTAQPLSIAAHGRRACVCAFVCCVWCVWCGVCVSFSSRLHALVD